MIMPRGIFGKGTAETQVLIYGLHTTVNKILQNQRYATVTHCFYIIILGWHGHHLESEFSGDRNREDGASFNSNRVAKRKYNSIEQQKCL